MSMIGTKERLLDADDLWEIAHLPEYENLSVELIDGVLITMPRPNVKHGMLASLVVLRVGVFVEDHDLGITTVESGYQPPDSTHTVLGPDVAFVSKARVPDPLPERFMPLMPDLAVEVRSPNDTYAQLREKARIYLENGSALVWIVLPERREVEVCRLDADGDMQSEIVGRDGTLSGEEVLPGLRLALSRLFG